MIHPILNQECMNQIKRIFLLSLLFWGTLLSNAQTWAPVGSKWTYTFGFAWQGQVDTLVIRSIGDTLIQGKQCKILHKSMSVCDLRNAKEYMYSDSGKVYFYDNSRSKFQMLFNINAATTSTWVYYMQDLPIQDSMIVKIDSISSISINSIILKEIFVKYSCSQPWVINGSGKIIENMGDTHYMFPWVFGACDVTFGGPLRCYDDNLIGRYETGVVSSCDFRNVGIKEESSPITEYKIYPNPFSNSITIESMYESNFRMASIEIFNLLGKCLFYSNFYNNIYTVDLYNQPDGIYFLKIQTNGKSSYYKITKQNIN